MPTAINNSAQNLTALVKNSRLIEVNLLLDHIGTTQCFFQRLNDIAVVELLGYK